MTILQHTPALPSTRSRLSIHVSQRNAMCADPGKTRPVPYVITTPPREPAAAMPHEPLIARREVLIYDVNSRTIANIKRTTWERQRPAPDRSRRITREAYPPCITQSASLAACPYNANPTAPDQRAPWPAPATRILQHPFSDLLQCGSRHAQRGGEWIVFYITLSRIGCTQSS